MTTLNRLATIFMASIILLNLTKTKRISSDIDSGLFYKDSIPLIKEEFTKLKNQKTFKEFLDKLSFRESSRNWKIINRFGYAGKYQMGKAALTDLNYTLNIDSFRINPNTFPEHIQDSLVIELFKLNRKRIKPYIKKYAGKVINGVYVTESGILAAAHLVGGGNVRKWLKSNGKKCPKDGNGTSIEEYLILFSNYKISIHS